VHIFCPTCGKHIDVSISEIEKLEGHYVCPQCLSEINLEGFEQAHNDQDYLDDEELGSQDYAPKNEVNESTAAPDVKTADKATAQPPAYKPQTQHRDDVMRYCKNCGAFLKKGVNFCPKCGQFVKVTPQVAPQVAPPSYQRPSSRPPKYARNYASNSQTNDPRNKIRPPMASSKRKPIKNNRQNNDKGQAKGIFSIPGCLVFTVIAVAIFFILYVLLGVHVEG
jgi:predicted RNA-binding Zn-ribbon protein involved in translation (DUF1610 family)